MACRLWTRANARTYLEVHRFHLVLEGVGLAHQGEHRRHLLGVMQVLHDSVEGPHDPAGVLPQLGTPLHLQGVLHVSKLAEVLLGRWEVHEEPGRRKGVSAEAGGFLLNPAGMAKMEVGLEKQACSRTAKGFHSHTELSSVTGSPSGQVLPGPPAGPV